MTRFGPYDVVGELGRGGFATVLRARSPAGADVAVKVLHQADASARQRFERERRLLALLGEEEGFVPYLDAGEANGLLYVVMPFVDGGTLRDRLERGPLPVAEVARLGAALAEAIGRAHARGIVHRDLKPENVLFLGDGRTGSRPLIADLGLAKHFRDDVGGASQSVSLSHSGAFKGTAGYMAPEQMSDARSATPAADVFALGAILHECLTGTPAFQGESALELLARVESGDVPRPAALRPETPGWLDAVVMRALARDPGRRFADGDALARALRAAEKGVARRRVVPFVAIAVAGIAALAIGHAVLREDPERLAEQLRERGRALSRQGKEREALAELDRAVELAPGLPGVWFSRGALRAQLGDLSGARSDLDRALALDPKLGPAWVVRGQVRYDSKDPKGALEDLARGVELEPRDANAWFLRAQVHVFFEDYPKALEDVSRAVELDPKLIAARGALAAIHAQLGDHDRALAEAEEVLKVNPGVLPALRARGMIRFERGDVDGAIADMRRYLESEPREAAIHASLALALRDKGDPKAALAEVDRAIELAPEDAGAWATRSAIRSILDDLDGARADAERAVALGPKVGQAWDALGLARAKAADLDGAIEAWTRAVELEPHAANAWMNLAQARTEKGDPDGAIDALDRALEAEPRNPRALADRAMAKVRKKDLAAAVADADRAIDVDATVVRGFMVRAQARAGQGDLDGAVADLEHALTLQPDEVETAQIQDLLVHYRDR